ncbi:MAG: hypothetical protein FJW68_05520 [Actinobacteria bacterium]|nr:hypothetical protein [Actinomycetota bacterium]
MSFLKSLKSFFAPPLNSGSSSFITLNIICNRCKENIKVNLRRTSDISRVYEEEDAPAGASFFIRKEILGNKCNNLIYFKGYFDENLNLISSDITGGKIVD